MSSINKKIENIFDFYKIAFTNDIFEANLSRLLQPQLCVSLRFPHTIRSDLSIRLVAQSPR